MELFEKPSLNKL